MQRSSGIEKVQDGRGSHCLVDPGNLESIVCREALALAADLHLTRIKIASDCIGGGHPQCVVKSGSISDIWLLKLVLYIVEVVPN
jgi:hypothetical protein